MVASWQHYGTYDESAHPDLWNGVVGYWAPCLGPTGLRLHDVSRYNNWGTLTNMDAATDWIVRNGQYALDFDGSNDWVATTFNAVLSDFTAMVWVYYAGGGLFARLVDKSVIGGFWIGRDGVNNQNNLGGGIRQTTGNFGIFLPAKINAINFVGMSRKNDLQTIAVANADGFTTTSQLCTTTATNTTSMLIGNDGGGGGGALLGDISDVCVWSRAFDVNDFARLYDLGRGGMLQRRSRRRAYSQQAGFRAHYATQRNAQLIGGGLR
jgi:hypothetical protein